MTKCASVCALQLKHSCSSRVHVNAHGVHMGLSVHMKTHKQEDVQGDIYMKI